MALDWQQIPSDAPENLQGSIPAKWRLLRLLNSSLTDVCSVLRDCGLLTAQQLEITQQTASELVPQLREGKLSSVEVTDAFCGRAAIASRRLSCYEMVPIY